MAITTTPVSEATYRRLALGNTHLELHQGQLWEKPGMSVAHGDIMTHLISLLDRQLDRAEFRWSSQHAKLRVAQDTYFEPDVVVIPTALVLALLKSPRALDAYSEPLPLVVEIWSPSTGSYDIEEKIPGYQRRGDLEIWFIHPYERTLTAWRKQPDGSYVEPSFQGGTIHPLALPGVTIDLDVLFTP